MIEAISIAAAAAAGSGVEVFVVIVGGIIAFNKWLKWYTRRERRG